MAWGKLSDPHAEPRSTDRRHPRPRALCGREGCEAAAHDADAAEAEAAEADAAEADARAAGPLSQAAKDQDVLQAQELVAEKRFSNLPYSVASDLCQCWLPSRSTQNRSPVP